MNVTIRKMRRRLKCGSARGQEYTVQSHFRRKSPAGGRTGQDPFSIVGPLCLGSPHQTRDAGTHLPKPSCEEVAEEISINMSYYYYF